MYLFSKLQCTEISTEQFGSKCYVAMQMNFKPTGGLTMRVVPRRSLEETDA